MRRLRHVVLGLSTLAVIAAGGCFGLFQASQSVPDFYAEALSRSGESADQAGDALEQQMVTLHNELQSGESWELQMSDQQVNGWLATDLKQKFPQLLPAEIVEPRVVFREDAAHVACRLDTGKMSTVLSLKLQAYLTEQPNEVAIRIAHVRAGLLPVPLTQLLDRISATALASGLSLRWSQVEGDPVALVTLPTDRDDLRSGVLLEKLAVSPGMLCVAGIADADQPRVAESTAEISRSQR